MDETIIQPGTPQAPGMKPSELERFLAQRRVAVLSWTTPLGEVVATPIWFTYRDGAFLLHTNHPSPKTRAILKNSQVALVIQDEAPPYRYVSLRGEARLRQESEEALRLYEDQARAYFGRLGGGAYLRRSLADYAGEHVIIEITPTKIRAMDGTAAVGPMQLLGLRAARKLGL